MIILFGTRGRVRTVGNLTMQCPFCGVTCAQALREARRFFTLFFIPIIPISHNSALVCSSCGQGRKIDKPQAEQMKAYLAGHAISSAGQPKETFGFANPGVAPAPPPSPRQLGAPGMGWGPPVVAPPDPGAPVQPPPPAPGAAHGPGATAAGWPAPVPPDPGATRPTLPPPDTRATGRPGI